MIDARIHDGMELDTFVFGRATVKRLLYEKTTGELYLDCVGEHGDEFPLSQQYAVKLMGPAK